MNATQASKPLKVLIVEDSPDDEALLLRELRKAGFEPVWRRVETREDYEKALESEPWDVVLSDFSLPQFNGLQALQILKHNGLEIPFILISGTIGEAVAVEAMKAGAQDYLMKGQLARVGATIKRELEEAAIRRAERQAREQIARQAAWIQRLLEAVIVMDSEARPVFWNKAAERLLEWSAEEVVGKTLLQIIPKEYAEPWIAAHLTALTKGECHRELVWVTRTNQNRLLDSHWSVYRGDRRQATEILLVASDITARKEAELQQLRSQRLENIGMLAGGVAHDLNNALVPVLMGASLLQASLSRPEDQQILRNMEKSAQHGADLVRQILTFARGMEGEHLEMQMHHLLKEVRDMVRSTFPPNIVLKLEVHPRLPVIRGSPTQIKQLLLNLCINARDAMPHGGELGVDARPLMVDDFYRQKHPSVPAGFYVVLRVSDTGTGIPPEVRERIFEPFFTTKEPGKGTGLGLATVRNIVQFHKGVVEVDSTPGKGTVFTVYFPAAASAQDSLSPDTRTPIPSGQGQMILLAEDEKNSRDLICQTLSNHGYRVVVAANGAEALQLFSSHPQDVALVITDLLMPVLDGSALIRLLRQLNPQVKIIAMSGSVVSPSNVDSLPGIVFMVKPFTAMELLEMIHRVLS